MPSSQPKTAAAGLVRRQVGVQRASPASSTRPPSPRKSSRRAPASAARTGGPGAARRPRRAADQPRPGAGPAGTGSAAPARATSAMLAPLFVRAEPAVAVARSRTTPATRRSGRARGSAPRPGRRPARGRRTRRASASSASPCASRSSSRSDRRGGAERIERAAQVVEEAGRGHLGRAHRPAGVSRWPRATTTSQPASASRLAATRPLGPAPTTTASTVSASHDSLR